MKKLLLIPTAFLLLFSAFCSYAEKPIQHRIVPDITAFDEAKKVFAETTSQIKRKTLLDAQELHDIHMITYSLEKAIAYFAETFDGDAKSASEKLAEVVELIHLGSENNRKVETEIYMKEYFKLAEAFAEEL